MLPQGRARPTLAKLYNWRYEDLGDLPYVTTAPDFLRANPGFAHDFQFIDVPEYQGRGESEPVPHFYQVTHCKCQCIHSLSWAHFGFQSTVSEFRMPGGMLSERLLAASMRNGKWLQAELLYEVTACWPL